VLILTTGGTRLRSKVAPYLAEGKMISEEEEVIAEVGVAHEMELMGAMYVKEGVALSHVHHLHAACRFWIEL
jgi:hypothetical protein